MHNDNFYKGGKEFFLALLVTVIIALCMGYLDSLRRERRQSTYGKKTPKRKTNNRKSKNKKFMGDKTVLSRNVVANFPIKKEINYSNAIRLLF